MPASSRFNSAMPSFVCDCTEMERGLGMPQPLPLPLRLRLSLEVNAEQQLLQGDCGSAGSGSGSETGASTATEWTPEAPFAVKSDSEVVHVTSVLSHALASQQQGAAAATAADAAALSSLWPNLGSASQVAHFVLMGLWLTSRISGLWAPPGMSAWSNEHRLLQMEPS